MIDPTMKPAPESRWFPRIFFEKTDRLWSDCQIVLFPANCPREKAIPCPDFQIDGFKWLDCTKGFMVNFTENEKSEIAVAVRGCKNWETGYDEIVGVIENIIAAR
jgi:hypothetical protein